MQRVMSLLEKLDYYSSQPRVYFKSKDSHFTWAGLILSLAIAIVVFLTISNFSQNFLYKTKPFILNSKQHFEVIPQFDLGDTAKWTLSFFFNFQITEFLMDPTIFTVECLLQQVTNLEERGINVTLIPIELEPCRRDSFPKETSEATLKNLNFQKNLCFKRNSTNKPILEGLWGSERFNMLYVNLRKCKNNSISGVICKSTQEINAIISGGHFGANVLDNMLDLENYERLA